jgi:branched-chain amino acid transport system ATP-binding protein
VSLLAAESLTVRYGGNVAVDDVSLVVEPGSVAGLIGPNGAGKTTLFNAICGVLVPTSGTVRFAGRDITELPTHKRARLGIGRTFQRLEVFGTLSVRDNVRVGVEIREGWTRRRGDTARDVDELLDRVDLRAVADRRVDQLPTGQARLVELARALAIQPQLLLLDEPASGLSERETEAIGALLRRLAHDGVSILLVEHDIGLVTRICEYVYVLDLGSVIGEGSAAEVCRNPAVIDAYLGRPPGEAS